MRKRSYVPIRGHRPLCIAIVALAAIVVVSAVTPAQACVYRNKIRQFNRAIARYFANPSGPRAAQVCNQRDNIDCKFKNKPGTPTPAVPAGIVPPCGPVGSTKSGARGGGRRGGPPAGPIPPPPPGPMGGPGGAGNGQPGGAPAGAHGFIRNLNSFDCDYDYTVTADPNNPAGFTLLTPAMGTIFVPAHTTAFVPVDIGIDPNVPDGTMAFFEVHWTEVCTGLPVIDDLDTIKITASTDFTITPNVPGVPIGSGLPAFVSWTITNHTAGTLIKDYHFGVLVDPYSVGGLNDGTPVGMTNVFPFDKSNTGGTLIIPPLASITLRLGDTEGAPGPGGNSEVVDCGPLLDGEFCDPEMLNCKGIEIDGLESHILVYNDEGGDYRDSSPAFNLTGEPAGGEVIVQFNNSNGPFFVNAFTSPTMSVPEILDQLALNMMQQAATQNNFNFVPIVDELGMHVLRSPDTNIQFLSFDPGLQWIMDVWPDHDKDGDVDLGDFSQFSLCYGGSNAPSPPSCNSFNDFDNDGDVDLGDFAQFSLCFGGANAPPPPTCTAK